MPKQTSKGLAERLHAEAPLAVLEHPVDTFTADSQNLVNVPLAMITPNPDQPRKHFDPERLGELAESIKSKGVLQPIIVKRLDSESFLLVAGERRYRASLMAGLEKVPAIISTDNVQEIALIENLQRENLNPLEEAEGLKQLAEAAGYTHQQLAQIIGKSRVTVTELLSLNELPDQIKEECRATDSASKTHLLQVLREPELEAQLSLWEGIKTGQFSTKQIRRDKAAVNPKKKPFSVKFPIDRLEATVSVKFKNHDVAPEDVLKALREATKSQRKLISDQ